MSDNAKNIQPLFVLPNIALKTIRLYLSNIKDIASIQSHHFKVCNVNKYQKYIEYIYFNYKFLIAHNSIFVEPKYDPEILRKLKNEIKYKLEDLYPFQRKQSLYPDMSSYYIENPIIIKDINTVVFNYIKKLFDLCSGNYQIINLLLIDNELEYLLNLIAYIECLKTYNCKNKFDAIIENYYKYASKSNQLAKLILFKNSTESIIKNIQNIYFDARILFNPAKNMNVNISEMFYDEYLLKKIAIIHNIKVAITLNYTMIFNMGKIFGEYVGNQQSQKISNILQNLDLINFEEKDREFLQNMREIIILSSQKYISLYNFEICVNNLFVKCCCQMPTSKSVNYFNLSNASTNNIHNSLLFCKLFNIQSYESDLELLMVIFKQDEQIKQLRCEQKNTELILENIKKERDQVIDENIKLNNNIAEQQEIHENDIRELLNNGRSFVQKNTN